jgi:hypothetical protein
VLLGVTFLNECVAFAFAKLFGNNMPVYGVFNLIQMTLLGLYFNRAIDRFRARNIGLKLALVGVLIGLANLIFFQPLTAFNSYFLLLESIAVISFCLFLFARLMLQPEGGPVLSNPHFWIATILTFFWSVTFFYWGVREYIIAAHHDKFWIAGVLLIVVNMVTYAGLGAVFLFYPFLQRKQ